MAANPTAEELDARAVDAADPAQAARLRSEAQGLREIEVADRVVDALQTLEAAVRQTSPQALPALVERLARCYGRAMRRLGAAEREAVRRTLRTARGER